MSVLFDEFEKALEQSTRAEYWASNLEIHRRFGRMKIARRKLIKAIEELEQRP